MNPPSASNASEVDARAIARVLDRLARAAQPPWLHAEVARRMAQRLPVIRAQPQTWIDWSGFLGASQAVVREVYPRARRIVVEPTEALERRSQEQSWLPWWSPKRWRAPADVLQRRGDWPVDAAQLLWANMSLHTCVDAVDVLARWHRALQAEGFLMFSTLGPDTLRELRAIYSAQGWAAPHAAFVDMHDWGDRLVQAGFADPVMDQELITLTWSSPLAMLDELRLLGANVSCLRAKGLRTPRWKRRLMDTLAASADAQGRVALTFEIVYGHAFRPAPRPARSGVATVSVDRLRDNLPSRARRAGP
jgi:malonyl-CoA O-methyltransferase